MRIASVPADHPFVRHIRRRSPGPVEYLPESYHEPGRWWPPLKFSPQWLRDNGAALDVLHVHFGLESYAIDHVREVADLLRRLGVALVMTVHDLQHPHLQDDGHHLDQLDILVPQADAVTTLTGGAARWIRDRWGREAEVIRHPHVVPLEQLPVSAAPGDTITVHLKDLRAAIDIRPLEADLVTLLQSHRVELVARHPALGEDTPQAQAVARLQAAGAALRTHARLDDDQLHQQVRGSRVQVLPYVRGTHSGWLEMCADLGVGVAVPSVGYLPEQVRDVSRAQSFDPFTPGELVRAVERLLATPITDQHAWRALRTAERDQVARAYERIYRHVSGMATDRLQFSSRETGTSRWRARANSARPFA